MKFAILGSNPALSIAEWTRVYGLEISKIQLSKDVLLLDAAPSEAIERLSGIVKAGEILPTTVKPEETAVVDAIAAALPHIPRLTFGISIYASGDETTAKRLAGRHQAIGITVKRVLKEQGRVRFLGSKTPALASVAVETNGLTGPEGAEICLFVTKTGILLGRTQAVQDFKSWSQRDFGRPGRDAKSGMLPPKLARLMLNLSGIDPKGAAVLDPFCGSGTVLMEAALLGFQRIAGGDNAQKAITDTQMNVEWLEAEYLGPHPDPWPNVEIHHVEAASLPDELKGPFDAIVTEPYLGPPRTGRESVQQLDTTVNELRTLYRESFAALVGLLSRGGTVVAAIPAFRQASTLIPVPVLDDFRNLGLKIIPALPPDIPKWLAAGLGPQGGLLYEREGQRVARELLIFERL